MIYSMISPKWKHLTHIILCAAFLYLFCNNTLLRPSFPNAQNKEYCLGVMLLLLCYMNAFVFHPMFFQRNKTTAYLVSTFGSMLVGLTVECLWMYPGIMNCIRETMSAKDARSYYLGCVFFVSLRDIGLMSFTFLVCEFYRNRHNEKNTEKLVLQSENKLFVKDLTGNTVLLNYKDIRFCEQEQNITKIYGKEGRIFFRYGSLKSFQEMLAEGFFVQINRKTLVAKTQIQKYVDGQLWLADEKEPLEVSLAFRNQKELLISEVRSKNQKKEGEKNSKGKDTSTENKRATEVFRIIASNPGISAVSISEKIQQSLSTVNRALRQLREEGLIEYTGSKKTGGYRVVVEKATGN